ncbi:MAG TPA: acetylglutamate kinase [Terriglobales bacterium]|nr:acetylglutamate kinase [Terriglobales bacterium]
MRVVVKVGGSAIEQPELLARCMRSVAGLVKEGHQVALVHGGGAALTRTLKQLGKTSEFVNGLRVTDAETRDVAVMVLAGQVNKTVVAALAAAGVAAVGLSGGDGVSFRARKKKEGGVDLGFVGEIAATDSRWLEAIWQAGGVPVLSSVALGTDGQYYNVNADQMAAACAIACKANALIFLTDVPGVRGADGGVMRWLVVRDIPELVSSAVVNGGMLPKLEACRQALSRGVGRVRILPADQVEVLPDFYYSRIDAGTEVMVQ